MTIRATALDGINELNTQISSFDDLSLPSSFIIRISSLFTMLARPLTLSNRPFIIMGLSMPKRFHPGIFTVGELTDEEVRSEGV
jgi:hypothetical protein